MITLAIINFTPENGTITFSTPAQLNEKLIALAESAVLSLVEGNSRPWAGERSGGVERSYQFHPFGPARGFNRAGA